MTAESNSESSTESSADCIFCRIVAGQLPSRQVLADDHAVAFLDLAPLQRGHTLVVPRRHVDDFTVGAGALAEIAPATERVGALVRERLGAEGVNLISSAGAVAGQEVFHLHLHVVPRYADAPGLRNLFAGKHGADEAELDAVLAELAAAPDASR